MDVVNLEGKKAVYLVVTGTAWIIGLLTTFLACRNWQAKPSATLKAVGLFLWIPMLISALIVGWTFAHKTYEELAVLLLFPCAAVLMIGGICYYALWCATKNWMLLPRAGIRALILAVVFTPTIVIKDGVGILPLIVVFLWDPRDPVEFFRGVIFGWVPFVVVWLFFCLLIIVMNVIRRRTETGSQETGKAPQRLEAQSK
jgi:hypothetical protein